MRRNGGDKVECGYYWNLGTLEVVSVLAESDRVLPGGRDTRYLRLPALAALALGPILGGLFILLFPIIGFAAFLAYVGVKAADAAVWAFMEVSVVLAPRWEPGVAYFAGRKKAGAAPAGGGGAPSKDDGKLDELLREIAARRRGDGDGKA